MPPMTLSYVESGVLSKFCQGFKPEGANLRCRLFQQRSTRRRTLGFRSDRNPLAAAHNLKPARARSVRRKPDRRLPLRTLPTRLVSASADCAMVGPESCANSFEPKRHIRNGLAFARNRLERHTNSHVVDRDAPAVLSGKLFN